MYAPPVATPQEFVELVLKSDKFMADLQRLLAQPITLNATVNVDEAGAKAAIAAIDELNPEITAGVVLDESAAKAALASLDEMAPVINAVVEVDDAAAVAAVAAIDEMTPIVNAVVEVDDAAAIARFDALTEAASVAADKVVGEFGTAGGAVAASLDEAGSAVASLTAAYTGLAVGVDVLAESEAATVPILEAVAAGEQAVAASTIAVGAAAQASAVSLNASSLGFTRLGGSLGLVAGQLLGLPGPLNLLIALLGRDAIKIATKAIDGLTSSTKAATVATDAEAVAQEALAATQGTLSAANGLSAASEDALSAAYARAAAAGEITISASEALAIADENLAVAAASLTLAVEAQTVADEELALAQGGMAGSLDVATASQLAQAAAADTAAASDELLAAASAQAEAAQLAMGAASSAGIPILIGVAAAVGVAVLAYKLFEDGSKKAIDVTQALGKELDTEVQKLIATGTAVKTLGTSLEGTAQSTAVLDEAIAKAFAGTGKDAVANFTKDLANLDFTAKSFGSAVTGGSTRETVLNNLRERFGLDPAVSAAIINEAKQQDESINEAIKDAAKGRQAGLSPASVQANPFTPEQQAALASAAAILNKTADVTKAVAAALDDVRVNSDAYTRSLLSQAEASAAGDKADINRVQVLQTFTDLLSSSANAFKIFQLNQQQATDPQFLKAYTEALTGSAAAQTDLDAVTSKYGVTAQQAFAIGKKQQDDITANFHAQVAATKAVIDGIIKQAKTDQDAFKAHEKAVADQKLKDIQAHDAVFADVKAKLIAESADTGTALAQIARMSADAQLGITQLGELGFNRITAAGKLTTQELTIVSKDLDNLKSATDAWAKSITDKLFPSAESLFGTVAGEFEKTTKVVTEKIKEIKRVKQTDGTFKDETVTITRKVNVKLDPLVDFEKKLNEQILQAAVITDDTKALVTQGFTNTVKVFGDITAQEGPKAGEAFYKQFNAATPAKKAQLEALLKTYQDQATQAADQWKSIGTAIGAAIAPEIVLAINTALNGGGQSAVESATRQAQVEADTLERNLHKVKPVIAVTTDPKSLIDIHDEIGNAVAKPVPIAVDTGTVPGAIEKAIEDANKVVALQGDTLDIENKLKHGFDATVRLIPHVGSTILSYAGGVLTAGQKSIVNELGQESWLGQGSKVPQLINLPSWGTFTAPGPGSVIDHVTTAALFAQQRDALSSITAHLGQNAQGASTAPQPVSAGLGGRPRLNVENINIVADAPGRARSEVEAALNALLRRV